MLPVEAFDLRADGRRRAARCRACRPALALTRTCTTCGEAKPLDAFYVRRSGLQAGRLHASCKTCQKARAAETYRRSRKTRESPSYGTDAIRGVLEVGHDDRCIVWEPGPNGPCMYVTADHCPCETFATHGDCAHRRKALELLTTHERRAA